MRQQVNILHNGCQFGSTIAPLCNSNVTARTPNSRYSYKLGARRVTVDAIVGVTTSNNSYPSLFLAYTVQEYTDKVNCCQVSKYVLVSGFTARSPLCNHVAGIACRLAWRMSRAPTIVHTTATILSW